MKIAYILPSLANMGPIMVANVIIENLIDKVDTIDVYYFDDKIGLDFKCKTIQIESIRKPINFDSYDIIHSHGYRPDKYVSKFKKSIRKAKIVSTIHSDIRKDLSYTYNPIISYLFTRLWHRNLRQMDAVVVISKKLLSIYSSTFENISIIHNGIRVCYSPENNDAIQKIRDLKNKGLKIIGTYAAITKRKGIDMLISLLDRRKDIGLVIIGEGKEKKHLQNWVNRKGYSDRVLFFPYLHKPYNYIDDFDVYAMPSRSEGFGLAMVEAAMCKIPVVCSDIEVFREIFDETQAVFFELENIKSLSNAIDYAIENRNILTENACDKVTGYFTGVAMANNYLNFYNTIIGNGKI